jgi:acyl carrier protein
MDDVTGVIRQYILTTFLAGEPPDDLRNDTPLQTSGILDSLAAQNLIAFLEQRFGVELDVFDTSVERFDCIEHIAATVEAKRDASPPVPRAS